MNAFHPAELPPPPAALPEVEARRVRQQSSTSLAEAVVGASDGRVPPTSPFAVLSGREREVVALIAAGLSTKEVAGRLHVSAKTVETHRAHALAKLSVSGVAGLTKYAVREGLSPLYE